MKRISIIGLCLMAVMAVSAIGVASASAALPEFVATKYPVGFTSESKLPLEPALKSTILGKEENIICQMSKDKGEVTGPMDAAKVEVLYSGCKEQNFPTDKCGNDPTPASGNIVTKVLDGLIGYVPGGLSAKTVGLEILPTSGSIFVEFTCEGSHAEKVKVEGCSVGRVSPINTKSVTGELLFEENAGKTGQLYTEIDGGHHTPCKLLTHAGFFELGEGPSWVMDTEVETFGESIEVKA